MTTLTEFVLARIEDDEAVAQAAILLGGVWRPSVWGDGSLAISEERDDDEQLVTTWEPRSDVEPDEAADAPVSQFNHIARHDPARVLRECEAKREIVEAHRKWPVLITTPPKLETSDSADTMSVTMRMTQQIEWRTQEEYRTKFGDEPPTAPMIRALAMIYQDHPDFRDEWR